MNRRMVILLSILLLSLVALALRPYYSPSETELDIGLTGEARINDWLAAERVLRRMGVRTEALRSRAWRDRLPYSEGVLMVEPSGIQMEPARKETLHEWIDGGGHLIVALSPNAKCADEAEHWVDDFTVDIVSDVECEGAVPEILDTFENLGLDIDKLLSPPAEEASEPAQVDIDDVTLAVTFSNYPRLRLETTPAAEVIAADEHGTCIAQGPYGYGLVTVICDRNLFDNLDLAKEDRAELLFRLVSQTRYDDTSDADTGWRVWLDHWGPRWDTTPALPVWLWRKAPVTIALAGFALFLGLWAASRRLGPRIGLPEPGRREIMEHVEACGRFTWRAGAERTMLEALVASLEELLNVRVPGWNHVPEEERAAKLAHLSGLDEERIRVAMYATGQSAQDKEPRAVEVQARNVRKHFPALVRTLERLRRTL